ncbi:MAG: hypothetical protein ACI4TK_03075 [Agathobacter sp.]
MSSIGAGWDYFTFYYGMGSTIIIQDGNKVMKVDFAQRTEDSKAKIIPDEEWIPIVYDNLVKYH